MNSKKNEYINEIQEQKTTGKKRFSGNEIGPLFFIHYLCLQRPRKFISSGLIY